MKNLFTIIILALSINAFAQTHKPTASEKAKMEADAKEKMDALFAGIDTSAAASNQTQIILLEKNKREIYGKLKCSFIPSNSMSTYKLIDSGGNILYYTPNKGQDKEVPFKYYYSIYVSKKKSTAKNVDNLAVDYYKEISKLNPNGKYKNKEVTFNSNDFVQIQINEPDSGDGAYDAITLVGIGIKTYEIYDIRIQFGHFEKKYIEYYQDVVTTIMNSFQYD